MGATETIAKWIVNTSYEDIPPDAIRVANESCFDLLGVILAGSTQPVGEIIQKYTSSMGAAPESTVLAPMLLVFFYDYLDLFHFDSPIGTPNFLRTSVPFSLFT